MVVQARRCNAALYTNSYEKTSIREKLSWGGGGERDLKKLRWNKFLKEGKFAILTTE